MVNVPPRVPVAVGVKVTPIWQLAPGGRLVPKHVSFEIAKSPLFVTVAMFRLVSPTLVIVTV